MDSKTWNKKSKHDLLKYISLEEHSVRLYPNRIAISRYDKKDMNWEELQKVKQFILGDTVAIEVYPKEFDVVNLWNTRHLWYSTEITELMKNTCIHPEFTKSENEK